MKTTLTLQNLKCGGCANTITKNLRSLPGLAHLQIDRDTSQVSFEANNEKVITKLKESLRKMGYPAVGQDNPLMAKAKSYLSCAKGKMDGNG
ncbi:heavy-metal-associated domain-containing protein [Maribacter sp. 2307ULW6-5]|uniref:heavy-metal-associated domain-containing protein n=1 Tax=Maribacter sp. 2307ULW6-5 TaxID=3386275 RepID=UPI0039BD2EB6